MRTDIERQQPPPSPRLFEGGRMTYRVSITRAAASLTALLLGAAQAQAGFSSIATSHNPGEMNVPDVLGQAYGGKFTVAANGVDFTNGSLTATRIDDSADTVFAQPIVSARAVYGGDSFAGPSSFGYLAGAS